MKLARALALLAASSAMSASAAAAAPLPTAWQPVVSDSPAASGHYYTIGAPTNVSGVLTELPTTNIPAPGTGVLAWHASSHTLSWRGGPAVVVNPAISASYSLPQPATLGFTPPHISVAVTGGALPATDASDTLTVTSARATAGLGDGMRDSARGSAVFNGNIYLGLEDSRSDLGEVWRSGDGLTWVKAAPDSFGQGSAIEHVDNLIVYSGRLFAGTDSGQIWQTSDGTRWTQATPTPGYSQNETTFATFNQLLYVNQANSGAPGGVFRSSNGTSWANVFQFGEPQLEYAHDLQVFGGRLFSSIGSYKGYLGPGPGQIASSADGTTWQQSGADGFGNPNNTDISGLAVFGTALYAGTFNPTQGAEVWRTFDGKTWQRVASGGFGDPGNTVIHKLIVYGDALYAGTENDTKGGEIFRSADGVTWTLANVPGFGTGKYQRIRSFFKFGGYLYANGMNDVQENGWELWRLR